MHFMAVTALNTHGVAELQASNDQPLIQGTIRGIGSSLEVSVSQFNHSCVPSTLRLYCGRSTIIIASKDMSAGEEVGNHSCSSLIPGSIIICLILKP